VGRKSVPLNREEQTQRTVQERSKEQESLNKPQQKFRNTSAKIMLTGKPGRLFFIDITSEHLLQ